jgi:hypothetical protein
MKSPHSQEVICSSLRATTLTQPPPWSYPAPKHHDELSSPGAGARQCLMHLPLSVASAMHTSSTRSCPVARPCVDSLPRPGPFHLGLGSTPVGPGVPDEIDHPQSSTLPSHLDRDAGVQGIRPDARAGRPQHTTQGIPRYQQQATSGGAHPLPTPEVSGGCNRRSGGSGPLF